MFCQGFMIIQWPLPHYLLNIQYVYCYCDTPVAMSTPSLDLGFKIPLPIKELGLFGEMTTAGGESKDETEYLIVPDSKKLLKK